MSTHGKGHLLMSSWHRMGKTLYLPMSQTARKTLHMDLWTLTSIEAACLLRLQLARLCCY